MGGHVVFVQQKQLGMRPYITTVQAYINGQVSKDDDVLVVGIGL